MGLASIQTWAILIVQDRMIGANTGICKFDGVVTGLHVYQTVWIALTDETLQVHHTAIYQ